MITLVGFAFILFFIIFPIFSYQGSLHKQYLEAKVKEDKLNALRRRYITLQTLSDEQIEDEYNVDFIFYNSN